MVKPFDTQSLFESINEVLSDTKILEEMGKHGQLTLKEKYSLSAMSDKTLHLYEQIIASPKSI